MNTKKIINYSMLLAITIVLSIIENFIPTILFVKIGLANIIIIYALYKYGFKDALNISILRIIILGILRTGLFSITFLFSIAGALLSIIMMGLFKNTKLSVIGVSIIGSIFHMLGQLLVAFLLLNISILNYIPLILILSLITGLIIGLISKEIIEIDS